MPENITNVLWYIEFFAFAITLIGFITYALYLAELNYIQYSARYDIKKSAPLDAKPLCCESSCFWFLRLVLSVSTIALTYYFAYEFIADTKLRFGLFVH